MNRSIIVPVFNEEGNIGKLIDKINIQIDENDELIVIDDGSTDDTYSEVVNKRCNVIKLEKNMGKGFAMREGIKKSKGKLIIFLGGDGQDDPKEIHLLTEEIKNGYDYVIGSRFLDDNKDKQMYSNKAILPVNEFGNKSITFIINFLFGKNITDSQSEFKCFVADKLKEINLQTNRSEIETELLIKSFRKNFKIKEVPVHRYERKHGKSKLFDVPFGRFLFGLKVLRTIITGYFIWR